ncbi:hypothetical protein T310_7059 [Rasamsonia emersonii CBS 393.64]|uniref:MFS transporter n=1 Tax=Rasamsonia emersonii (strain ATCC 16479 / CBS 393.64 / IMI 116815) TaxID=1408163 RepID=A0A0F4YMV8_RASE3|nr:hypothetical protein T310_7059 [Rasamsonia emersonii CBS 393.64]KKA18973.1 hypothetical protein T310_7059 [Rasamsonia emersonii CBS 393.64]
MSLSPEKASSDTVQVGQEGDSSTSNLAPFEADWTVEEERRLVRRIDSIVMPLLMLAFFALQLDRGNIKVQMADSLFYLQWKRPDGFLPPRRGNHAGPVQRRAAVAVTGNRRSGDHKSGKSDERTIQELSCDIPSFPERSRRVLEHEVAPGIEGLFGILVGIIFILFFPQSTANPVNLLRTQYFTERETQILVRRLLLDDPSKHHRHKNITRQEILRTVGSVVTHDSSHQLTRRYAARKLASLPARHPDDRRPGTVVDNVVVCPDAHQLVWVSTTKVECPRLGRAVAAAGTECAMGDGGLANRLAIYSHNHQERYALLTLAITVSTIWRTSSHNIQHTYILQYALLIERFPTDPVNGSWMALNARTAGERSITLAIFIMAANSSGIVGSQLFQASDAPLYRVGWTTIIALASVALFFSVFAVVQYWVLNRWGEGRSGEIDGGRRELYHL